MNDLEKEIQAQLEALGMGHGGWGDGLTDEQLRKAFEHFWKVGFQTKESLRCLEQILEKIKQN